MGWAVHPPVVLTADLPALLSLLLPMGFNCIKKQVFEGYCFVFIPTPRVFSSFFLS